MTEHNQADTTDESNNEQTLADLAPAHHEDGTTPEEAAAAYADDPSPETFEAVVEAVRNEYDRNGHDPVDDTVLTPVGLAARLAADEIAEGSDIIDGAWSSIDFDGSDEVTVEYDAFAQDDTHADPMPVVRLATYADDATDRTVRFRGGTGGDIYVEVPERREDDDDEDFADSFDEAVGNDDEVDSFEDAVDAVDEDR